MHNEKGEYIVHTLDKSALTSINGVKLKEICDSCDTAEEVYEKIETQLQYFKNIVTQIEY